MEDCRMSLSHLTRRRFLSAGAYSALEATSRPLFAGQPPEAPHFATKSSTPAANPLEEKLDAYVATYIPAMNAPGMTVGLTDSAKTLRTVGYGLANIDAKLPVTPDHLFSIGSISKSFVALVLLQLGEEGKLDLHKPVLNYLPWLPIAEPFGPITAHHLLTHTSGLPDGWALILSAPDARHTQGFAPGEHFYYSNLGFVILGQLVVKLDGRPWYECVKARIFTPLEMHDTEGVVTTAARLRSPVGYQPFWDDEVYPRQGRLAVAGNFVSDNTAGCIRSTSGDMSRYLRMLVNRGKTPTTRIVSEESFALMSTPYIKAEELSPTASYGYGIAVDTLDGHKILRHTGGWISFASSIHVDLDGGVAAFASINAIQGYRPTAVTQYAVRLLRAQRESKPLPEPEPLANPEEIANAVDYAGSYKAEDGGELVFQAERRGDEQRLLLLADGKPVPLQNVDEDVFFSTVPGSYTTYALVFQRESSPAGPAGGDATKQHRIVQVSYGPKWYAAKDYSGPRTFSVPDDYSAFVGHYRADSAFFSGARVYVLQGKLVLQENFWFGVSSLTRIGGNLFRVGEEDWKPETVEFTTVADGKARVMKLAGMDYRRMEIP